MRHRLKHHANRPVLHWGLFTDEQMMPCACLFALAVAWFYVGGGLAGRTLGAALLLVPVGVMVVDNRLGGVVADQVRARLRWRREPGVFAPGAEQAHGYELSVDDGDAQRELQREQLASVDLEAVFAAET